ncbi:Alpha/Beta hydrolase protein [Ilyonectria destructans]|nr:Alpha/Beta hydrolase protein [Ilyonectria destructans]
MRLYSALLAAATASVMAAGPYPLAQTVRTKYVNLNGTKLAYRRFGKPIGNPIIYFTHFRGDMDTTDPLLFNYIAQYREVILFDNAGVGHSEGIVQNSVEGMGDTAVALIQALNVSKVVPLGFSLGGQIAQYVSWQYPKLVEKAVFSGTIPGPGPGTATPDPAVLEAAAQPHEPTVEDFLFLFFSPTETSQAAGRAWFQRRPDRRVKDETQSTPLAEAGITAQVTAINTFASSPDNFARLQDIKVPVLVTSGHTDIMLVTVNSFVLQQQLPYAYLNIYPDSGHGHLFQFPKAYAEALRDFLNG